MTAPELHSFARATRIDLRARRDDLVLVPVGACEQHGPHLPTGTDSIVVDTVAHEVAALLRDDFRVVVAPTLPVGYSRHHVPFGATISVSAATLQSFLIEMCGSLVAGGFTRLFLLNGHGGNADILNVVAREVALQHGVTVGAGSYWVMAWDALVDAGAHEHARLPGHAGAFETSLMMAMHPELVRRDDVPSRDGEFSSDPSGFHGPYLVENQANWLAIDGYSDSPAAARAEDGERWFAAVVDGVGIALRRFHAGAATSSLPTARSAGTGE